MTRESNLRERLASNQPDLVADLYLYATQEGGKTIPIRLGWGAPCAGDKGFQEAWDGYPLLECEMMPGERRRVGFVFLSGLKAVAALRPNGRFYLNEGRVIGEAIIVE